MNVNYYRYICLRKEGCPIRFGRRVQGLAKDRARWGTPSLLSSIRPLGGFTKELDECENLYERLMYALKNMQNWNKMPDNLKEQVFQRLEQLAAVANLSEENRIAYDRALDRYRVNRIVEEDVREEGRKEGREEGREEGEAQERIRNARAMKAEGIPAALIARITGLPLEAIDVL